MWIVLFDHSDSMGEPFAQSGETSRRIRLVDAEVKLEAAKEVLLEELRELKDSDPEMRLAIFAFTDEANLIYDGLVTDLGSIDRALRALSPHNGTDIAAALNAAADYKETHLDSTLTQLVLISDGKSDRVKAMAAARRCLERQLALSMLLIDPTEEGKVFARDVVRGVGGTCQTVTSRELLREATKVIVDSHTANRARAEGYIKSARFEARGIEEGVADGERVKVTSGYPGIIDRERDYLLRVYLHLETQLQEVLTRLDQVADQFGVHPRKGDAEPHQRIPIGTRLEITPRINRIGVSPPQQVVTWVGSIEELSFRIYFAALEENPPPCCGFIDISTNGLLLAQIPVSIQIEVGPSLLQRRTADLISRVFASYSHKDEQIVRACKATYRALGIQLFVDKDDILSGQVWRDVLRRSIADHDLFQLFWSKAAADSDEVANEWSLAKEVASARTTDFIRPLYWAEPMPEPPQALRDLHFARLDLGSLRLPDGKSDVLAVPPTASACQEKQFEASFPVINTVDSGTSRVPWLQERMWVVVPFLEDLIGVRYFPPVTFLVDEHAVRAAREVLTTDSPDNCEDILESVLDILQALALGFHVGKLVDPETRWDKRAAFFEAHGGERRQDYDHVVYMAEYVFSGPTKAHLAGKDVLADIRRSLGSVLKSIVEGGSEYYAAEMVKQTLQRVSTAEHAALSNVVPDETLEQLGSFKETTKKAAAARLLASDLPRLADKYEVFEFFSQTTQHSLRNHRTFEEYLADFVRHWLGYIKVAKSKGPDAVIDVGYSASHSALAWLQHTFPDIRFHVLRNERGWRNDSPQDYFEMYIGDYERCVEKLAGLLFPMLSSGQGGRIAKLVNSAVSTHGIYMPASSSEAERQLVRSLTERGWPVNAALPGQHKVLLSIGALDRFEKKLVDSGRDKDEAEGLARRFCLSVLVHEHFHAAVATGLDQAGRAALGVERPDGWKTAGPLNESLAVWCERHFFRADAKMLQQIDSYIASGVYPIWPYRGGKVIESFYVEGGMPAVRGWIRHLRDDPENAQREFNQRVCDGYT